MNAPLTGMDIGRQSAPVTRADGRPREAYLLGQRLFKDTLVRERKRADRLNASFAVIVLDRGHDTDGDWGSVLRAAGLVKRDGDMLGWLEQGTVLGLILPEASRDLTHKVVRRLRRHLAADPEAAGTASLSTRVYVHGARWKDTGAHLPPVDLLIDAFVPVHTDRAADLAKRAVDIVGSVLLLALFAPLMLLAYLSVRMTSPGAALFRQVRIGRRGEPFTMLKFRSMRADAGNALHNEYVTWFITSSGTQPRSGGEVFKLTNDSRVTAVGNLLRKTSLDELPQFWNVLRGDMSLVGPRPPLPFEVDKYQPWHRRRVLEAKPGITGLWQVNGRSRTTFDEMVRMDLEYARTRTLWGDIRILAATPFAMFKGAA
ncbi:UDP-glucose:undecaprenyl-phosphate glucose-1-phosphate transferase [Luteitalea pratensis]|uniref:UDP-glucose:undecaprenyl-phosphate glucose-1-phosphate transferase n=1 Tax=Luteitalea pratensis TaxID=1855912 RepID=A0A143PX98_LUTPR|nr:sugar transferase [Luteitalea pratensis]AMY12991.1 UDP-glucose:undecaprenyl-phosphate glucose-1-phosphate transferase [Luteitalea pratensis]